MKYSDEIKKSMHFLAKQKKTIFLGQSISYPGNLLYYGLKDVKKSKKIETPIFEDTQMGIAIGLSLNGYIPINCYPRFDFFLLAFNQLINHLDKIYDISSKEFSPFVVNRVLVGAKKPVDAGLQHTQNYTKELKSMAKNLKIVELKDKKKIISTYKDIYKKKESTVVVEYSELYNK